MKCRHCNKQIKENTDGNLKYCQGHDVVLLSVRVEKKEVIEEPEYPITELVNTLEDQKTLLRAYIRTRKYDLAEAMRFQIRATEFLIDQIEKKIRGL